MPSETHKNVPLPQRLPQRPRLLRRPRRHADVGAAARRLRRTAQHATVARQTLDQVGTLLELGEPSGKAPHFIFAHLIGVDGIGHTLGPGSTEYEEHLRFLDAELGRLMGRLQHAGLYDHTAFLVVADHGQAAIETSVNMTRQFHLLLAEHASAEECTEQCRLPGLEVDGQPVLDTYDVVVTVGGYRDAVVYLQAPDREALLEALDDESRTPVTE
ncbi:MAG: alkaline phosphatase family protein, partial [Acidobacteria bacterium]|nr:alkaline phosphatase family protein [Acidobacteriota bacterium]